MVLFQPLEKLERTGAGLLVLDTPEALLAELRANAVYVTEIRTKFENFSEPAKPFVVYQGTPGELEKIWNIRYGGLR